MSDNYTEHSYTGFGSRLIDSIKGVFFGFVLIAVSMVVIFWNEGRAVHRQQTLEEGRASLVMATADRVDPANNAKLIYVTGDARSAAGASDPQFNFKAQDALRLQRKVEMYQWDESEKSETRSRLGGGQEKITTYTYDKVWREGVISSSGFKKPGHDNPPRAPFDSATFNAADAMLGAYKLNDTILSLLVPARALTPTPEALKKVQSDPAITGRPAAITNNAIQTGNVSSPQVGDVRVTFLKLPAGPISLVARQTGNTFEPHITKTGSILLIQAATVSPDLLFKEAEDENRNMTWIIRGVGFVLILIGFNMLFAPFVTLADVIPIIGSIIGAGAFLASFALTVPVWLFTVATAWIYYRPLIGIGMIAVGIAVPLCFKFMTAPAGRRR